MRRALALEDALQRAAGAQVVDQIIGEFVELVEDHVALLARQLVALVVDLLDVALGTRRAHDVGRVADPVLEPAEALGAHALGQHRDAVATEDARDRDTAPAVVAGRRPDRAVTGRVVLPGDDARRQTAVRRQHLVRGDHRETVAERHDDLGLDAGQRLGQHQVVGHRDARAPVGAVVPGDAEQVARFRRVGVDIGQRGNDRVGHRRRVGEFRELGQHDARGAKMRHRAGVVLAIDDLAFEAQSGHNGYSLGSRRGGS